MTLATLPFAILVLEREPAQWGDLQTGFISWLQIAGGFATFGLIFLCTRGRHERSEANIRQWGDTYKSTCRFCGKPMVRVTKRNWKIAADE